ncbi:MULTISPECIES: Na+/H+ antiporter NhaA [unclassified Brevibacterium]|uniref:Na+/H+ antiporter NhaA n=1 Tax=unclassified Brevibacterium TaxID=2614124 RepID=UPI001BA50365|nr:Na+/H+ antiporter NhaA [Brevibacterium sp. W7.2]
MSSAVPNPTDPTPSTVTAPPARERLARVLKHDAVGGILLLAATAAALIIANSPAADWYETVRSTKFGPEALKLNLSASSWASDGLLAIFFFVVGLELKEEFVAGKLRNPKTAAVPVAAAVGGVAIPSLLYVLVNLNSGGSALGGWAIPAATDIAFAVAIIAMVGKFLPPSLRTFLLTLAVVDDLLAIAIIAIFYTDDLSWLPLGLALLPLLAFAVAVQRGIHAWWLLFPLAFATWTLVHASGIHATIAGVLLGFMVPVAAKRHGGRRTGDHRGFHAHDGIHGTEGHGPAAQFADKWSIPSAVIAVPIFAFFAAGVNVGGLSGLAESLGSPVALGIMLGLVVGKPLGITLATFLITRVRGFSLDRTMQWVDVVGVSCLAGVGFTVSLLIGDLSFGADDPRAQVVKVGVLFGSLLAALLGAVWLSVRNRHYRILAAHVDAGTRTTAAQD